MESFPIDFNFVISWHPFSTATVNSSSSIHLPSLFWNSKSPILTLMNSAENYYTTMLSARENNPFSLCAICDISIRRTSTLHNRTASDQGQRDVTDPPRFIVATVHNALKGQSGISTWRERFVELCLLYKPAACVYCISSI